MLNWEGYEMKQSWHILWHYITFHRGKERTISASVAILWVAVLTWYLMYSFSCRNANHYTVTLVKPNDNINFLRRKMEMLKTGAQRGRTA